MKTIALAASMLLLFAACDSQVETPSAGSSADSSSLDRLAGDKTQMAELMRRSHEKGTFDDALTLVMRDSIIAEAVFDATITDDRFIAITSIGTPVAPAGTSPSSASEAKAKKQSAANTTTSTRTTPTPAKKGDVLNDAERTAQKANERLEQAARIKREAEEAKRKVEVILGR